MAKIPRCKISVESVLQDKRYSTSLIQTKLNRPPLPMDFVAWPRFTAWLEKRRSRLLSPVSAPAGYGKYPLISCWLESMDCRTAWLSLFENWSARLEEMDFNI